MSVIELKLLATALLFTNMWMFFRIMEGYWIPKWIKRRWNRFWQRQWDKFKTKFHWLFKEEVRSQKPLEDFVGKSHFKMPHVIAAEREQKRKEILESGTDVETEEAVLIVEESTSARRFKQVPDDKLDETFSDTRIESLATYSEEEEKPTDGYADGVTFDDIDNAVETVTDRFASYKERTEAGKVFHEMEGNEFYEMFIRNHQEYKSRIHEMVGQYLGSMSSKPIIKSVKTTVQKTSVRRNSRTFVRVPDNIEDFDIRNYV